MNLRKSPEFLGDVERQFRWYVQQADWQVAERYLSAVEATCTLIAAQPGLGAIPRFSHPRLQGWQLFMVFRPFQRHLLFYEVREDAIEMRRAMHGHRDLPKRLLESPGTE